MAAFSRKTDGSCLISLDASPKVALCRNDIVYKSNSVFLSVAGVVAICHVPYY